MKDSKKLQADCMQEVKYAGIVPGTVATQRPDATLVAGYEAWQ